MGFELGSQTLDCLKVITARTGTAAVTSDILMAFWTIWLIVRYVFAHVLTIKDEGHD